MGAIGGIISGVGNIVAGNQAAKAQKQAAKLADQRYQEIKGYSEPYLSAGTDALDLYRTSIGLNGTEAQGDYYNNFQTDPGWQASQDNALRGLSNLNAIQGRGGLSGNLVAGLGDYLQKNMLDAYKTRQSQIGGLVDTGKSALSGLSGASQAFTQQQGNALANAGYYQGAGLANAGNAIMQGFGGQQQSNAYGSGLSGAASPGNGLMSLLGLG